jgi:hypothetical protein
MSEKDDFIRRRSAQIDKSVWISTGRAKKDKAQNILNSLGKMIADAKKLGKELSPEDIREFLADAGLSFSNEEEIYEELGKLAKEDEEEK